MQEALAALESPATPVEEYGKDLAISDDDLSGSADSEDLFEDLDDGDDGDFYYSSDNLDDVLDGGDINQDWLRRKCTAYCSRHGAYGSRPDELQMELVALLVSGNNSMFDAVNDHCNCKVNGSMLIWPFLFSRRRSATVFVGGYVRLR